MSKVKVAAVQMRCAPTVEENYSTLKHWCVKLQRTARRLFCCRSCGSVRISASSVAMISISMHCYGRKSCGADGQAFSEGAEYRSAYQFF